MSGLTAEIAGFIANASLQAMPEAVLGKAKKCVADTFGVMLAGAHSEVAPPILRYLDQGGARGDAAVLGTGLSTSPEMAAFANATFGHALDFDDVLSMMVAHPSSVIVGALLGAAAGKKISGRQFLEAYIVGVEVGAKIGLGITVGHFGRGFHSQGTLCTFSALAGIAKLRSLDTATTQLAFGIASSLASGVRRNVGTMTKPLHAGWAARNAMAAADLASFGLTAAPDALEAKTGFFGAFGVDASDPAVTSKGLGNPWTVADPGLAIKRFPCCHASHRAMDGLLTLRQKMNFTVDTVKQVDCRYPPGGTTPVASYPEPTTGLQGKFSLQYSLAAGVLDGAYTLWSFKDEAVLRPEIKPLLRKIRVSEEVHCGNNDPHLESRSFGSRGFVEVEVTMTDGRNEMIRVDHPPGHPRRELEWNEIQAKFMDCASTAHIDSNGAESVFKRLANLEACNDVNEIAALLLTK